ncbi:hypothetical protein [Legionella fairfieldensis]|uniref:hypothetical protein n=1 Tax=Legionella fairfieldensis TaxID=45064 RepID=UPI00048AC10D|nr:hypothetical protein [Legionella fairfieldensis]
MPSFTVVQIPGDEQKLVDNRALLKSLQTGDFFHCFWAKFETEKEASDTVAIWTPNGIAVIVQYEVVENNFKIISAKFRYGKDTLPLPKPLIVSVNEKGQMQPKSVKELTALTSDETLPLIDLTLSDESPNMAHINAAPNHLSVNSRTDVMEVQKEIDRLERNSRSIFGINNKKKADKIRTALENAINRGTEDVTKDSEVREALGFHRIFGFFGFKTANALKNIENPEKGKGLSK